MRRAWVVVALLLCSCAAFSMDNDVKHVAAALEQQYGMKFHKLPLIARVVMKPVLWGSGVKLEVLAFEGATPETTDAAELDAAIKSSLGPEWSAFIRSSSNKTKERAVIYVRNAGKNFDMLIASLETGEAAVLKLRLKPDEMKKWMDEPGEMARHHDMDREKDKHKAKDKHKDQPAQQPASREGENAEVAKAD